MAAADTSSICVREWLSRYIRYTSAAGTCSSDSVAQMTAQVFDAELGQGCPPNRLLTETMSGVIRGATAAGEDLAPVVKGAMLAIGTSLLDAGLEPAASVRQAGWKCIQLAVECGADPRQASSGVLGAIESLSTRFLTLAPALNELLCEFTSVGYQFSGGQWA